MTEHLIFKDFLQTLARSLGVHSLSVDPHGVCMVEMKESGILLLFEYDDFLVPDTILLSSRIRAFSSNQLKDTCLACLQANQMIEETFSIHPEEETVYLHRRIYPKIEATELLTVIDTFIQHSAMARPEQGQEVQSPEEQPLPFHRYKA